MSLVKVTKKNGEVIHVLPEEVPGLKEAGLLKEAKEPGKTKEEKSIGQTKKVTGKVKTDPSKPRPVNISHTNIKGVSPKKT